MTRIFKNKNGLTSEIIEQKGDYTLLHCQQTGQYIIAWKLGVDDWCQGYYFFAEYKEQAFEFFQVKTNAAA